MGKSCTILAHVRNRNGEIVESRLFKDLLHYTGENRELAKEYYAVGTSEEFLSRVRDSEDFKTDENGEITFPSLRTLSKMDIESDKLMQILNKDIKEGEYDYIEALARINDFNEHNSFADKVIATMYPTGKGKYYVTVVPKTKTVVNSEGKEEKEGNTINEQQKLHDVVRNEELERKIKSLLAKHKVSITFLEGDREGGRYSTVNAAKMADGLWGLIEINKTGHTTDVLAEEAGHFAVGALGNNPLVKRLESLLDSLEAQKEALGEEEYSSSFLGDNPSREVAGRLVGKALQRKLDKNSVFNVLANRIANLAKRVFYNFTGNEVRWAAAKAEQIANKIAYNFVEGDNSFSVQNAISIKETMLSSSLSINQRVYRETVDELGRMVKKLQAIAGDQFTDEMKASLGMTVISGTNLRTGMSALQMPGAIADDFAFNGIVQALVQVTDYLGPDKEIDQLMKAVNLDNPADFYANMARNGRYLRQARTFLRSAELIIDTIQTALDKSALGGTLKLANGSTLTDVKYQDENGVWKSINMKNALVTYKNIIAATKSELNNLEATYFARFCEDVYGSKYITSTVSKTWKDIWHGTEALGEQSQSIADMVQGIGMEDIDIFHRYLGSMANNPDIIGQIIDKVVKAANKTADDATLKYKDRLYILQQRAKDLGLNLEDLIERDENGVPTGNMITPPAAPSETGNTEEDAICAAYMEDMQLDDPADIPAVNFGAWEKARDEHKKEAWEEFKRQNPDWKAMSGFIRGFKWDAFLRGDRTYSMKKWNEANSIRVEIKDPKTGEVQYIKWVPNRLYASDAWDKVKAKYDEKNKNSNSKDSITRWVHDYRKIKAELDAMLPIGATTSYRLPQFRGTFMNAVRSTKALEKDSFKRIRAWGKTFGRRVILEMFGIESDETDYGDLTTMNSPDEELLGTKLDYEEERAARIPIFGINKLKNINDLSTDILHSMLAYASMATSYKCLDNVVDGIEVGAEALYNRNIRGKKNALEKGLVKVGNKWRKASGRHEVREAGEKNRAYGRYLKYLDKQVYGISATYWGISIGKSKRILLNKLIQNISSLGGSLFLKGNIMGGTVNTLTGYFNIFKEATVGDIFDAKDWLYARGYYWKHFVPMWTTDLGKLHKNNKLSLFLDQMNAQSNSRTEARTWFTNRSRLNNFYRMVGYLPYSSGDHFMQATSYLAVAHGTKLYDEEGKEKSNLWNAYKHVSNKDEYEEFSKGSTLEFDRFSPLSSNQITSSVLDERGVYLKEAVKSTADFEEWLLLQDEDFADEGYRSSHIDEYNDYRAQYDKLSAKEMMQYKSNQFNCLASILQKVEGHLSSSSPLLSVPVFTPEEEQYLRLKRRDPRYRNIGTGNYNDILQAVRDDIYKLIWTKSDESAYMDKCREVNDRLHGIYNEQDKTAWHQQWYTNAFLAMKGWCLGYLEYMYSPNHYSAALGRNVEGFVQTAAKVFASGIAGMFGGHNQLSFWDMVISMMAPWSKKSNEVMQKAGFSEEQNFNMRRAFASNALMLLLLMLRIATAAPDKDERKDDEELDPMTGLIHYFAMRTLLEQEAFLWVPEMFIQSGQYMDFVPVGFAALFDLGKLGYETVGAIVGDKEDSDFFYQRADRKDRYEEGESKAWVHFERLIPYYKNVWALQHGYEATENYEFGRKLRTR